MYSYKEALNRQQKDTRTLSGAFLRRVAGDPRKHCITDPFASINRIKLAAACMAMRKLIPMKRQRFIGVMLPPGIGGTMANIIIALDGRVSVNLNHTVGTEQLKRMFAIAGIETVISAQRYLDKIGNPEIPVKVVLLDKDIRPKVSKLKVLWYMILFYLGLTFGFDKAKKEDIATVLFSSGTTGDPKGICLTHEQILAHCDSIDKTLIEKEGSDVTLMSSLPLFHSFGLINGMWSPLASGVQIAAYPNPRDAQGLGEFAAKTNPTMTVSTPTFARTYLKRIKPEHFRKLQYIVVGAEKCSAELKQTFHEVFGAEVFEGYGCTELSPTVSTEIPDRLAFPEFASGKRSGSVGRPLAGIEVLIVDPETHEELPVGEEGLIVVRSPARMQGYLNRPDLTEQVFILGGYNTGDIGKLDEDNFLYITGRLARFAKIGGEMIPLDKVEEVLQDFLISNHGEEFQLAIAAVPDAKKGEKIVALHTGLPCSEEEILKAAEKLPPIFKPKKTDFYRVPEIPVLGTGKRDLKAVKRLAERTVAG